MSNNLKNTKKIISKKIIKIMMFNINSVCPRLEELILFVMDNKLDIVMLNEIKVDKHRSNFHLNIPGFTTIDKPRNNHGCGVAILIKNEIVHHQIYDLIASILRS